MNQLILVKYAAEIFLKGLNRGKFERRLKENIEKKLSGLQFEFVTDQGRGFIKAEDIDAAVERVRKVFGVAEVCIVTEVERDLTAIKEEALRKVKEANPKTFKIETNRANKPKKLINLDGDFKFMNICEVNVRDKDAKCVLIGKNSTSQINMSNIRSSDLARIPKKVPISLVGLVTYKL